MTVCFIGLSLSSPESSEEDGISGESSGFESISEALVSLCWLDSVSIEVEGIDRVATGGLTRGMSSAGLVIFATGFEAMVGLLRPVGEGDKPSKILSSSSDMVFFES
jgi:hypothetical protein